MNKKIADESKAVLYRKKLLLLLLSAVVPILIFCLQPLAMTVRQSAVLATLLLVIIWWCTGIVPKTAASVVLILVFTLFSGASVKTVFSFPLSSTFLLIALTYLFSRGVSNSGLTERYLEPLLRRFGSTPLKVLLLCILMQLITMYAIPQPLARLIIITDIVGAYLLKTNADENLRSTLLFGLFTVYIFVNMLTMKADIILNTTAVSASGLQMTDGEWIRYMTVPSLLFLLVMLLLFMLLFRKDVGSVRLTPRQNAQPAEERKPLDRKGKAMLVLVALTMVLWLTESLHGIPNWVVTLGSIVLMYCMGILHLPDLKAIDVPMLVFLTAAMSIGGVMSASGIADILFSALRNLLSGGSVTYVVLAVMVITICMHMMLGSNTTTLSVVIPGVVYVCQQTLPVPIIMFLVYVTSVSQWLFPFHSVGLMMGASKNYFSSKHVLKMGIPLTVLVFVMVFAVYLPWWKLLGLMGG